jgi:hypothetical protein
MRIEHWICALLGKKRWDCYIHVYPDSEDEVEVWIFYEEILLPDLRIGHRETRFVEPWGDRYTGSGPGSEEGRKEGDPVQSCISDHASIPPTPPGQRL